MTVYHAPLRDMRFVLHELLDIEGQLGALTGFEDLSVELVDHILEEAGKVGEQVLRPTNQAGDREGCTRHADGRVTTPGGFPAAYAALTGGGWTSIACDPAHGGHGMPGVLHAFVEEIVMSSNLALSLYSGLTYGAYVTINRYGSEAMRDLYLPKLASGEWSGCMCLTEAHCGTDLGLLRTRATPAADDSYRLSGTKIFITGGEQDLTPNIVHLVLARLPDAPPGVRGISLFLVPKRLPDAAGEAGAANGVECLSIEHKMGIHGASTCVMGFEEATGWLVGEPHRGLPTLFSMMNHERLMVGQQGLALAEVGYQSAVAYARDRMQGRAAAGARFPEQPADPIIVHPDVRRMLLDTRAFTEGARALFGWVRTQVDVLEKHPDAATREAAEDLVALFIPVVKAFLTDAGSEACNACLQVFGGHGYIALSGMEQLVRDARIAQIYEGANGIQALDLAGRKLAMHDGRLVRRYFAVLDEFLATHDAAQLGEFTTPLAESLVRLRDATDWLRAEAAHDPEAVGAASVEYLRLFGLTAMAHMWAWSAAVASARLDGDNSGFYATKLATARYFMRRVLPRGGASLCTIKAGSATLMALDEAAF